MRVWPSQMQQESRRIKHLRLDQIALFYNNDQSKKKFAKLDEATQTCTGVTFRLLSLLLG